MTFNELNVSTAQSGKELLRNTAVNVKQEWKTKQNSAWIYIQSECNERKDFQ